MWKAVSAYASGGEEAVNMTGGQAATHCCNIKSRSRCQSLRSGLKLLSESRAPRRRRLDRQLRKLLRHDVRLERSKPSPETPQPLKRSPLAVFASVAEQATGDVHSNSMARSCRSSNATSKRESAVNLKKVGARRYAADPTTSVLCICYAVDDGPIESFVPEDRQAACPQVFFDGCTTIPTGPSPPTTIRSRARSRNTC